MAITNLEHGTPFPSYRVSPKHHMENETSIEIVASDAHSIQNELTRAVESLLGNAKPDESRGILVTRHSFFSFTVSFSTDVPHRTTNELDLTEGASMKPGPTHVSRTLP